MVRRTKADAMATRENVLDAAAWCFRTHGIGKTTMSMIADTAELSRGAVYWHFREKEQILAALLQRGHLPLVEKLQELSQAPPPLLPALHACMLDLIRDVWEKQHIRDALEIVVRHGDFAGQCHALWPSQSETMKNAYVLLQVIFKRAADAGEISISLAPLGARLTSFVLLETLRECAIQPDSHNESHQGLENLDVLFAWLRKCLRKEKSWPGYYDL